MKARVNQDLCVGCGLCVTLNPEVFEMNENGLADAVNDSNDEELLDSAMDSCPVSAISEEE